MEVIEFGALVILCINAIIIPWAIWTTKSIFKLQSDLALNNQNDANLKSILDGINTKLDNIESEIKDFNKEFERIKLRFAEDGKKL